MDFLSQFTKIVSLVFVCNVVTMKFLAASLSLVAMTLPNVLPTDYNESILEQSFPAVHRLSLEKVSRIMRTEASDVCAGSNKETTMQTCWENLLHAEIDRIRSIGHSSFLRRRVTQDAHVTTPFVVCDVEYAQSGEARKTLVAESLGTDLMINLYNKQDMSCFALRSTVSLVQALPDNFRAIPILPEMKIPKGTMEAISGWDVPFGRVEAIMCPGVEDLGTLLAEVEQLVKETDMAGHRHLRFDNFVTFRSRVVTENHPWHRALGNGTTNCHHILSEARVDSYGDTIMFAISPSYRGEEWPSCLQMLVAEIALHEDVCFVGAYEDPQILNDFASGIVQSGASGSKLMYDVGLDGNGQVVAMSDSGIDIDNCYFYDSEQSTPKSSIGTVNGQVNPLARKVVQYVSFADDNDYANGHGSKSQHCQITPEFFLALRTLT